MDESGLTTKKKFLDNSLAWAEMNLILANMIWHFDIELAENNVQDWSGEQKVYGIHEVLPLNIRIRTRLL